MPITRKPRDSTGISTELKEIRRLHEIIDDYRQQLEDGRSFLMSAEGKVSPQDALVAFGWTKDGLAILKGIPVIEE